MGFTGLARWINAPTTGIELISQNILRNHQGQYRGKWHLSVKSYRSTLGNTPDFHIVSERNMCTLTMDDTVFVLLDDPAAPTRADYLQHLADGHNYTPSHYRNTFLTLSPPGALDQLLTQLRARWVPVRQGTGMKGQGTGQQLTIDGSIYAIGTDWIVRAGNVILAGGAVKGILLEAEYLPLPTLLHTQTADGTSELVNGLLLSVLPNLPDAKTAAVTISDMQWEEVLWNREEEEEEQAKQERENALSPEDDIFVSDSDSLPTERRGDWVGVDRDRRSAYLIIGALRSEGIL